MPTRDDDRAPWTLEGVADPLAHRQTLEQPAERRGSPVPDPAPTPRPEPPAGGTELASRRLALLVPYVVVAVGFAVAAIVADGGVSSAADVGRGRVALAGGAVLFGILAWQALRHRVVLHGRFLHHRAGGWRPPVDLDRLENAGIERIPMGGRGITVRAPILVLRDLDGRRVMVDRVNGDVEPLYRELARRYPEGDPVIDATLAPRIDRLRGPADD